MGRPPLPPPHTHWSGVREQEWNYTTITAVYNTTAVVVYERAHPRSFPGTWSANVKVIG